MTDKVWLSADECNAMLPDHDFGSTIDNLESVYDTSPRLKCWQSERVSTQQIDPGQLIDDPDDVDGHRKTESIREAIRSGSFVPPVIIIHRPTHDVYPFVLIEGRHRFNAAHRECATHMLAWVAHLGCCGGPGPDL